MARLEKISRIVLLFAALASLGLVANRIYSHRQSTTATPRPGTSIVLPQVRWSATKYNVVLAISTDCHYCRESAAFYHNLAALPEQANVIIVSNDDRAAIERFLKSQAISASQIVYAAFEDIGVRGTPTVLVVNQSGVVQKVLAGKQSPEEEAKFLSQVRDRSL